MTFHPATQSTTSVDLASAAWHFGIGLLRLPFDSAREQYALGVRAGLIERSMLAARDFELRLAMAEQATLGLLARRV